MKKTKILTTTIKVIKKPDVVKAKTPKPKFLVGFEIEGAFPNPNARDYSYMIPSGARSACQKIYNGKLRFDDDGSIYVGMKWIPCEIKTPPLEATVAIEKCIALFKILNELGFITNYSCGFHVNVSEPNILKKDFPVRDRFAYGFIKNFNAKKWRKSYHRTNSQWCRQFNVPENFKSYNEQNFIGKGQSVYVKTNSCWIQPEHRRLELRVAGCKDYHVKIPLFKSYIADVCETLVKAYDYTMEHLPSTRVPAPAVIKAKKS